MKTFTLLMRRIIHICLNYSRLQVTYIATDLSVLLDFPKFHIINQVNFNTMLQLESYNYTTYAKFKSLI